MTATSRSPAPPRTGAARLLATAGLRPGLESHLATFGPLRLATDLADVAAQADLRGRGGAAFPTGQKLAAVAAQTGRPIVVANGAEGEPASKKDRSLLRVAPHLVLDGAELAARSLGAREVLIGVTHISVELADAIRERMRHGQGRVGYDLRIVPDRFVAGEETALLQALAGRDPKPTRKPPYPFARGYDGRPTLVQNVETLAHLALIARFGAEWYEQGTALLTVSGAARRPGVHEVPFGTTLAEAIDACGGTTEQVEAYLVGGYFGEWVSAGDASRLRLTPERIGAGAIVALPRQTCPAAEVARVTAYLAGESAGQCGPCVHGLRSIADALAVEQPADERERIERWAGMVSGRGACRHPDGAVRFVRSAMRIFADEFAEHARRPGCGRSCLGVLPLGPR